MPLSNTWERSDVGRLHGTWVFADYANMFVDAAPSARLRGHVACVPKRPMWAIEGSVVGEVQEQQQIVDESNSTIEFFLHPGTWNVHFSLFQLRVNDLVDNRVWPGRPLRSYQVMLEVIAGEDYPLVELLSSIVNIDSDVEYMDLTDSNVGVFGRGVRSDDEMNVVTLVGSGFTVNQDGSITLSEERYR